MTLLVIISYEILAHLISKVKRLYSDAFVKL